MEDRYVDSEIFPGMKAVPAQEVVKRVPRRSGTLNERGFIVRAYEYPTSPLNEVLVSVRQPRPEPRQWPQGVATPVHEQCNTCNGNGWIIEQEGGGPPERKTCPQCHGSGNA